MSSWDPFELCELDDLCTGLILDPMLNFVTHKMNPLHRPERRNWPFIKRILDEFQILSTDLRQNQYRKTFQRLKDEVPSWWQPYGTTPEEMQKKVQDQIFLYLKLWDPSSGYTIKGCSRYSKDGKDRKGGTLVASRAYKKNEVISELKGCIARMSPEQQRAILVEGKNDYSVQYSTNKKQSQLWLGPASFLNHDCKPNAKIESTGARTASVKTLSDVKENEEILIFYGKEFFGYENCECECRTCERREVGKFQSKERKYSTNSPTKVMSGKYGLRETASRKRRAEENFSETSDDSESSVYVSKGNEKRKIRSERIRKIRVSQLVQGNKYI